MTSYRFKVQLDDIDIWLLEDILREHIAKTYLEDPKLKEMFDKGHLLHTEKILIKLKESVHRGLEEILKSEDNLND